jgi:hypothetical protein
MLHDWVAWKYDLEPSELDLLDIHMKIRPQTWLGGNTMHHKFGLFENFTLDLVQWKQHHTPGVFANMTSCWRGGNSTTQLDCLKILSQTCWGGNSATQLDCLQIRPHHGEMETPTHNWIVWKWDLRSGEVETAPHIWIVCKYDIMLVRCKNHHTTRLFENTTSDLMWW